MSCGKHPKSLAQLLSRCKDIPFVHKKARSLRVFLFSLDHMMRDEIHGGHPVGRLFFRQSARSGQKVKRSLLKHYVIQRVKPLFFTLNCNSLQNLALSAKPIGLFNHRHQVKYFKMKLKPCGLIAPIMGVQFGQNKVRPTINRQKVRSS